MITYSFENVDGPIYEYIYKSIKTDILDGNLKSGEKLPSKRTFAKNNGISTITIQNAYDQLISEGYIYTVPKKGYYVSKLDNIQTPPKAQSISLGIRMPSKEVEFETDLSGNSMNPDNFPFSVWARLGRETISEKSSELMEKSPSGGISELRQAIAEHLRSFRGMLVDPDQIIIGAGTEYLYGLLVQLIGSDKIYCTENPGYKKLAWIYAQHGIDCRVADIDNNGISPEGLIKSGADIAHISPNHHFPTGITMPASRRYEVLAWANEKPERYIIEDDYDSEFRPSGKPIPTLFSIDGCEKVIYMNTFSKTLTPTIRISYMILPVHLANRYYDRLSYYSCTVSNFEQYTLSAFITQGYFEKHINRMRLFYSRQRQKILQCISSSKLRNKCTVIENDSGLHFLLQFDTKRNDAEIKKVLAAQGINIKAMYEYYLNPNINDHIFILDYSNIQTDNLINAFDKITEIL